MTEKRSEIIRSTDVLDQILQARLEHDSVTFDVKGHVSHALREQMDAICHLLGMSCRVRLSWKNVVDVFNKTHDVNQTCAVMSDELKLRLGCSQHAWRISAERRLGAGAFGQVFGARRVAVEVKDAEARRYVAKIVKIGTMLGLRRYTMRDALRETAVMVVAGEQGIGPRVYDAWLCEKQGDESVLEDSLDAMAQDLFKEAQGTYLFVVMDHAPGVPLGEWIREKRRLPPRSILQHIRTLVDTMHDMHILHNDLHCYNVLVATTAGGDEPKTACIIDFGEATFGPEPLSKQQRERDWDALVTTSSVEYLARVLGEPPPEFIRAWDEGKLSKTGELAFDIAALANVRPLRKLLQLRGLSQPERFLDLWKRKHGVYQEEPTGSFTHDGKRYNLNCVLRAVAREPIETFRVTDLVWILDAAPLPDTPETKRRIERADLHAPILVTPYDGKWAVIDGAHRLAKARSLGWGGLPARQVSPNVLAQCRITS